MKNPYAWNIVNPQLFYGRSALLRRMLDGLTGYPRHSFGLAGGRRMGKTTLLRRLELEIQAEAPRYQSAGIRVVSVYVDGLLLPRPLTASAIWTLILRELQSGLGVERLPFPDEMELNVFIDLVQPLIRSVPEHCRIVVLFDEIEPILVNSWADGFLANWRALLSNKPGLSEHFSAAFAGAREIARLQRDIGSPLKDILEWESLRVLEFAPACDLMQEPIAAQWPPEFLANAYTQTGGHPMLVQYVMQQVTSTLNAEPSAALAAAVQRFSAERRWQFSEWWERYCTPGARRVYARLPSDGSMLELRLQVREFGLSEANDALEILQHIGLAVGDDEGLAFRYSGEMFRNWYQVYGQLDQEAVHDLQVYAKLIAFDGALGSKYLSAWQIYGMELPNYSGAVSEARDILTLLINEHLAPDDAVRGDPGFAPEQGQTRPTRSQRVRYVARQKYRRSERAREIESDVSLFETECEQLARLVTGAYGAASGLTHTTALRPQAYRLLRQFDSILLQLLPDEA